MKEGRKKIIKPEKLSQEVIQTLMAELNRLNGLFLHLVEHLKTKLNTYITIISAGAGIITIYLSAPPSTIQIILAVMLIVGAITFVGLVNGDLAIIRTIRSIRRIQRYLLNANQEAITHLSYDYWESPSRFTSFKATLIQGITAGGEKSIVSFVNSLVFASFCTLTVQRPLQLFTWWWTAIMFLGSLVMSGLFHVLYVRLMYRIKPTGAMSLEPLI